VTGQMQAFFHHYRAMDTRVLLARYRTGGLLPEAEAALLEVLADRGYIVEALDDNDADGIVALRVDEATEAHSFSTKARSALSVAGSWLKQKVAVVALHSKDRVRLRETWVQIARFGLLAACLWSAQLATLFGFGLFVTANVFCDSGPEARCFHMGLRFLEVGMTADVLLLPAMFALLFPKRWIAWYLKVVPPLSLAVFGASIHWYGILPMFCLKAAELSALIAFLAAAYLILSPKNVSGTIIQGPRGL